MEGGPRSLHRRRQRPRRARRARAGRDPLALAPRRRQARRDARGVLRARAAHVALPPKGKGLRDELLGHYKRVYDGRPGLEAALKRSGLAADAPCDRAVQILDDALRFAAGDFCSHPSGWGIGRVVEAHPETHEYVIDFARRRGQRMAATMAAKSVQKRDPDDLDVLLWTDQPKVKVLAEDDPLSLLKSALKSAPAGKLQARDLSEKLERGARQEPLDQVLGARPQARQGRPVDRGRRRSRRASSRCAPSPSRARPRSPSPSTRRAPSSRSSRPRAASCSRVAKDAVAKGQIPGWLRRASRRCRRTSTRRRAVARRPTGRPSCAP